MWLHYARFVRIARFVYLCGVEQRPKIAVVSNNSLMNIGLKSIIERIIPMVEVVVFGSAEELVVQPDGEFFHFFISAQIFADYNRYFQPRRRRVIVLVSSPNSILPSDVHTLNTSQSEDELIRSILRLHGSGHGHAHDCHGVGGHAEALLSSREQEVLALVVRGYINKEIAEMLSISINTVISHRRNIVERLGMSSVSALTIYAVMNGIVDISDI
ncbi:MAG: helix-turn-helix transcriptional regulator [Alistipes sp.]|nr:helix-turn-helix transcriptional regulator [Alistipes sp.]